MSEPRFLSRIFHHRLLRYVVGEAAFDRDSEEKANERKALIYTILIHLLLVLFLIISINWKSREPQGMQAEVWTPQQLAAATATANAQREAQTYGDPEPQPTPPTPEPAPPKPEPTPPKVQSKAESTKAPVTPKADIAIKQDKKSKEARPQDRAPDKKKSSDDFLNELKQEEQKLAAQKQQISAADKRVQHEAAMRAQAGAEAKATGVERARGDDRSYLSKLKTKIRGNVTLPPNVQGNPAAVFRVTQLPSGEVIDIQLMKSSGNPQLDVAVDRAIRKSSPLPIPEGRSPDRIIDITYLPFEKPPQ